MIVKETNNEAKTDATAQSINALLTDSFLISEKSYFNSSK